MGSTEGRRIAVDPKEDELGVFERQAGRFLCRHRYSQRTPRDLCPDDDTLTTAIVFLAERLEDRASGVSVHP